MPKTRVEYWQGKLERNRERDEEVQRKLEEDGWSVLVIWECQTAPSKLEQLIMRIVEFLEETTP